MSELRPLWVACLVWTSSLTGLAAETDASLAKVTTIDGQRWTGQVERRTDAQQLWLFRATPQSVWLKPVAWDEIAAVEHGGRIWTRAEFQDWAPQLLTRAPTFAELKPLTEGDAGRDAVATRPAYLHVEAGLKNWDADAAIDGLAVRLVPYDANDQPLSVSGIAYIELLARTYTPLEDPAALVRLGQWTMRQINAGPGVSAPRLLHLPFRDGPPTRHPLQPVGLIKVRLQMDGRLLVAQQPVHLAPYNPVRDDQILRSWLRHEHPSPFTID